MKRNNVSRLPRRRLRLTARDEEIVEYVASEGLATREQVQKLFFSPANRSRAQTRLGVLRAAGLLDVLPGRFPNEPAVYVLSGRTRRLFGPDDRAPRPVATGRLQHTLAIADCRVQFMLACRQPGLELLRWLGEDQLRGLTATSGVLPDAFAQVERQTPDGPRKSSFLIEVERTEKSERHLRDKLYGLGTYVYGGGAERDLGSRALRVLVLVRPLPGGSAVRLVSRVAALARMLGVTLVRVASLEEFLALPPGEALTKAVWTQPGVAEPVGLIPSGGVGRAEDRQAA